jgi:putative transposase
MLEWLDQQELSLPWDVARDQCLRLQKALSEFQRYRAQNLGWRQYPKWASAERQGSITFTRDWQLRDKKLFIPGVGEVRVRGIEQDESRNFYRCTIKREGDAWFAVLSFEDEIRPRTLRSKPRVAGVDVGMYRTCVLSNGKRFLPSSAQKKTFKKLQAAVLELVDLEKNDDRYSNLEREVQSLRRRLRNHQRVEAQTIIKYLLDRYDVIAIENLDIRAMSQNATTQQFKWAAKNAFFIEFGQMLNEQASKVGIEVLEVNASFTSQTCHSCGAVQKKFVTERWYDCSCGWSIDRDVNAAKVIRSRGIEELLSRI